MKIGFIGFGNMGQAIARNLIKQNEIAVELLISNHNLAKAEQFVTNTECHYQILNNQAIAKQADVIILGVKPQQILSVMRSIAEFANSKTLWISIATGVSLVTLSQNLVYDEAIIRMMPNTPIEIGYGMTTYVASNAVTATQKALFLQLFAQSGKLIEILESQMDIASVIAGCGPAFIYQLIEAMSDGAVREGLPRDLAKQLITQMVIGASEMVSQSGKHEGQLKDEVCSPGGSTIAGVAELEANGFRSVLIQAIHQSVTKTKEIASRFENN